MHLIAQKALSFLLLQFTIQYWESEQTRKKARKQARELPGLTCTDRTDRATVSAKSCSSKIILGFLINSVDNSWHLVAYTLLR